MYYIWINHFNEVEYYHNAKISVLKTKTFHSWKGVLRALPILIYKSGWSNDVKPLDCIDAFVSTSYTV